MSISDDDSTMTINQSVYSGLEPVNTSTPFHRLEDLLSSDPGKQVDYASGKQLGAPNDGIEPISKKDALQQKTFDDNNQQL